MYKVKIAHGQSGKIPHGYSSWLDYWKKKSGQEGVKCHKSLCYNFRNIVGVHVLKTDTNDNDLYIVPLCENHKELLEEFNVEGFLIKAKR